MNQSIVDEQTARIRQTSIALSTLKRQGLTHIACQQPSCHLQPKAARGIRRRTRIAENLPRTEFELLATSGISVQSTEFFRCTTPELVSQFLNPTAPT